MIRNFKNDGERTALTTTSEVAWVRALGAGTCNKSSGGESEERGQHCSEKKLEMFRLLKNGVADGLFIHFVGSLVTH